MKKSAAFRAHQSAARADAKMLALLLNRSFCRELGLANAWPHFSALRKALAEHRTAATDKWLAE